MRASSKQPRQANEGLGVAARRGLFFLLALPLWFALLASGAQAFVYWTNGGGEIGRASTDGSGANQSFASGASAPCGLAVDTAHLYWLNNNTNTIGRSNLDGSSSNGSFVPTSSPNGCDVAVDGSHVYWANLGTVGRANLDGTGVNQSFIGGAHNPYGVAVDGAHVYWANLGNGTIGRSNLDGTGVNQSFITGAAAPSGVAVDGAHVYWANLGNGTIGRSNLDGTGANESFITGADDPVGVAVGAGHVYWANYGEGTGTTIGRSNLDGGGVSQSFIDGAHAPTGVTVDQGGATSNFRAQAIEVTQAVQHTNLDPPSGGFAAYDGVVLAENGMTVVRFYANLSQGTGAVGGVPAVLLGWRSTSLLGPFGRLKSLPGGPLFPQTSSPVLTSGGTAVTEDQRDEPAGAYSFVLPPSWTKGVINLTAVVKPGNLDSIGAFADCPFTCFEQQNVTTLGGIAFTSTRTVRVNPEAVVTSQDLPNHEQPPFGSPQSVFSAANSVLPVGSGQLVVPPRYSLFINVDDIVSSNESGDDKNDDALSRLSSIDGLLGNLPGDVTIGVNDVPGQPLRGIEDGGSIFCGLPGCALHHRPVASVFAGRPLTSVAHELGHALGLPHAGGTCGGEGMDWPPDNAGYIHGVGLNRDSRAPFQIKYPGEAPDPNQFGNSQYFDYMSYCNGADENDTWISTNNWDTLLGALATGPPGQRRPAGQVSRVEPLQRAKHANSLHVVAYQIGGLTKIASVNRAQSQINIADSPYQLIARDASGKVVSQAGMTATTGHSPSDVETTFLTGDASPSAASVEIERNGQSVATLARSPHAPRVRLRSPRRGARVGGRRRISVRWHASDADGGAPMSRVDYSINNGRTWRPAFAGPNANGVRLPGSAIPRSKRARVRVVVSDGFNETIASSRRLVSLGSPPAVEISSPFPRTVVHRDADLYLSGSAFNDRMRELHGHRLTWYSGRKLLGHGNTLTARALPAGRQRVRLVATDHFGRRGSAGVRVRVIAVKPTFIELRAPSHISRHRRRLRLLVASSLPSELTIRGRRVRTLRVTVGRAKKKVRVELKPGGGALALHLRLKSGAKSAHQTLRIGR